MNFVYRVAEFFHGRYGLDKLCYFLIVLYLFLGALNLFVQSLIITIIALIIAAFALFRVLSRDISRRQREAQIFEGFLNRFLYFISYFKQKLLQSKNYCFHKCPHCKAKLRLPRKKGKHTVCCPRCKENFKMKVWF